MIMNETEYHVTCEQLSAFRVAIQSFDIEAKAKLIGSLILARAELDALKSEVEVLEAQIKEYVNR